MTNHELSNYKNGSSCPDPTGGKAVTFVDRERTEEEIRLYKLCKAIKYVCDLAGYDLMGRIDVVDRVTGRRHR